MDEQKNLIRHKDTGRESATDYEEPKGSRRPRNDCSRKINTRKVPVGIWLFEITGLLNFKPLLRYPILHLNACLARVVKLKIW